MTDQRLSSGDNPFGDGTEAEQARKHLASESALQPTPGPGGFFDDSGLLAEVLRKAIVDKLLLARAPGRFLYVYQSGVWKPGGNDAVSAKVVELLGNRSRITHAKLMVENITLTTPYVIDDTAKSEFINFRNGMLDWKSGKLHPHDPELMSVNQLPYNWDPTATCPRTDEFMGEVLHPDAIVLGYEMIGYAMFDGNPFHKAAMFLGSGANGKGVYLRLVNAVLGQDNVSAVPLQVLSGNRFASADLYGRLANVAGDLSSVAVEDTSGFKMITGGDLIRAERKFQHSFTFTARAFPIFSANELPGAADTSPGYQRRWLIVEFPRTFPPDSQDPRLSETLASERAGVAVKAVMALRELMERGHFSVVQSVVDSQEEMALALNPIKEFFDEELEIDAQSVTSRKAIYAAYTLWCTATGKQHPFGERRFWPKFRSEMMIQMGLTVWDKSLDVRSSSQRQMSGVRITSHGILPPVRTS